MSDRKPHLGPWLRRYTREEEPDRRERLTEIAVAGGIAVGALVLIVGVLWAFVRFPLPTFGVLVAVWTVGFVVFLGKKRRADLENELRRREMERERRPGR